MTLLKMDNDFLRDLEELEQRAGRLGLHLTRKGLNHAKNAAGWELAGNPEAAADALKGNRKGE